MCSLYYWSKSLWSTSNKWGQNVSIIGAISLKGIIAQSSLMGGTDAVTFEAFISQKLVPNCGQSLGNYG